MKLYINNPKEDWIADRLKKEWNEYNPKANKSSLFNSQIVWLMSPWTWKKIPKTYLKNRKVLCTIHHIDEDKFKDSEEKNFYSRGSKVENLINYLRSSKNVKKKTLSGCIIQKFEKSVIISPEIK